MKTWSVLVSLLLSLSAFAGPNDGGGGDNLANDFMEAGAVVKSLLKNHAVADVNEDYSTFETWLVRIYKSLDGKNPLLTFPEGKTVKCFGETKIGCVDEAGKISIARDTFSKMSNPDRYEIVALEIFKLMDVKDRYEKARKISKFTRAQFQTIESHVRFMVHYQISTFHLKGNDRDISLAQCVGIGETINRLDILAELVQILVLEGKYDLSVLKGAQALEQSARAFLPYCDINKFEGKPRNQAEAVARVERNIENMKKLIAGPTQMAVVPVEPIVIPPKEAPATVSNSPLIVQLKKTEKPGLVEGQFFNLKQDLQFSQSASGQSVWNYFSKGKRIAADELAFYEGQGFCAVNYTENNFPEGLNRNGVRTMPAAASPLLLYEISWYVNTVFLEGRVPGVGKAGIVVYCGTITKGETGKNQLTSLSAIRTHLRGILDLR